jgi:hypothetical protein
MWMGWPTHCTSQRSIASRQGDRACCQALSCLIVTVGSGGFRECEAPRVWIFDGELFASIPAILKLAYSKLFLPGEAYPMVESS